MYSLKFGFGKWHPFLQTAFSNPHWLRLVSLTVSNADSDKADADTFGRLASSSSVNEQNYKYKCKEKTAYGSFSKINYFKKNFHNQGRKGDTLLVANLDDCQEEDVLEKWKRFQDAHNEEVINSLSIVQDDSEEHYKYFLKKNGKEKNVEREASGVCNTPREGLQHASTVLGSENEEAVLTKATNSDEFGTIDPPKLDHVDEVGDKGDAREQRYQDSKLERKHSPVYYGLQMKCLCKERKLLDALKILEEVMPAAGVKPDDFCYQVLINACGRAGYTKKAFSLYNKMKHRGYKIQPVAYTGLFNACANSPWPTTDGLQRATVLREQLIEKGYLFNQITSHAMLKAFGRCGDINTAFQIVDDMILQGMLVTTETINFLLQACVSNKETGYRHALMVWRKMRELKLSPDIYSYNLLIRCIKDCGSGDPQLTSKLLVGNADISNKGTKEINKKQRLTEKVLVIENENEKDTSLARNASSPQYVAECAEITSKDSHNASENLNEQMYTMVEIEREIQVNTNENLVLPNLLGKKLTSGTVVSLGPLDQPQDRLALLGGPRGILEQMSRDRVKADLKTATQLLDSLPASTEAEEALLRSMKDIGLTPDTQFCNMLIRKRNFRKDGEAAKDVLEIMQDHHLLPDIITFGCLALGCRHLQNALDLLRDMDAAKFRPNLEIMTILIKNGLTKKNYFYTFEMLKEMNHRNIDPDDNLLKLLEIARTNARNFILKIENENADEKYSRQKVEEVRLYLLEYKNWLKKSKVQLPDHPWAQYKFTTPNHESTVASS